MGSMKDLHIESMGLTHEWFDLIGDILSQPAVGKAHVMRPDEAPDDEEAWEAMRLVPDLVFTPAGEDAPLAVEFKMFRWQTDWRRRSGDAIAHMREILRQGRYARGILLLSLDLGRQDLDELQVEAGSTIQIWSLARLDELANGDAALAERLELLALDTAMEWSSGSPLIAPQLTPRQDLFSPVRVPEQMPVAAEAVAPPAPLGAAIAARLRGTAPGHGGWQAYEAGCIDAVRFLFGRELHRPTPQKRSADWHHRMDLICRIRSEASSFWSMIESDFSTRYVVFEAKNSAEAVGQNEVELTAKYLFAKGLRTVAILFARAGSSDSARIAAEQTLRDRGTLVLILSLNELCGMLEGADAGNPPENFMFEKVDEFLMSLGR